MIKLKDGSLKSALRSVEGTPQRSEATQKGGDGAEGEGLGAQVNQAAETGLPGQETVLEER